MSTLLGHLYNCWQFNDSLAGINGQPFIIPTPVYEPGKFGNGLRLSAGVPDGPAIGTFTLRSGGMDWAGLFWLKLNALPAVSAVFGNQNSANAAYGGWKLQINSIGILSFSIRSGVSSNYTVYHDAPLVPGTEYLIIFGYDVTTQTSFLRVNDSQHNSTAFIANPGYPTNVALGCFPTQTVSSLDGVISLFTIWQARAFTESDLQALWNGGAGLNYPF